MTPGQRVRFIEPTGHRFVRIGIIDHVIARGARKGCIVIVAGGRQYTVSPDAIRKVLE